LAAVGVGSRSGVDEGFGLEEAGVGVATAAVVLLIPVWAVARNADSTSMKRAAEREWDFTGCRFTSYSLIMSKRSLLIALLLK
jgi:hypothetical protein